MSGYYKEGVRYGGDVVGVDSVEIRRLENRRGEKAEFLVRG